MSFADQIYSFLKDAIADGGASALSDVADFASTNRDLEVKSPAVLAMVCWGERGLVKIKELALTDPTSKNTSAALKTLASVAGGEEIQGLLFFLHDEEFRAIVNRYLTDLELKNAARHQLGELILSLSTDDLLIPLGTAFTQIAFANANLAEELVSALSTKWLRFGPPAIKTYEGLLKTNAGDESAFQNFFLRYPQFLEPMAVQVWSQPNFHGALEPDFVVRRADNTYLIVEIECPEKLIMTRANQLAAGATHAEKQAMEYRNFLMERLSEAQSIFPDLRNPDCLVVIGMEGNLLESQRKALTVTNEFRHNLRAVGFDWLGKRARAIVSNMSSGEIDVIPRLRMK